MLLRALLPVGWMPATVGPSTTLVICTMNGLKRVSLPDEPTKKQPSHEDRENGPCPFGAAAVAFAPPVAVALPLRRDAHMFAERAPHIVRVHIAAWANALGPRAPPSFV